MKRQRRYGRWTRQTTRRPADLTAVLESREARRLAALGSAVARVSAEDLSHELVALESGLPVGYLRWRYPDLGDLAALAAPA